MGIISSIKNSIKKLRRVSGLRLRYVGEEKVVRDERAARRREAELLEREHRYPELRRLFKEEVRPNTTRCPHCGHIFFYRLPNCPECGSINPLYSKQLVTCSECRHVHSIRDRACPKCGNPNPLYAKRIQAERAQKEAQMDIRTRKRGAPPPQPTPELGKFFETVKPISRGTRIKRGIGKAGVAAKPFKGAGEWGGRQVGKVGKTEYKGERIVCPYEDCGFGQYPHEEYFMKDKICPKCHRPNPYLKEALKEVTSLKKAAGKRVSATVYEIIIFEIAGILSLVIPPFLAFPWSFTYLAIALMVFIPGYILFPSEGDILRSLEPGQSLGAKGFLLMPKAFFKILAFGAILFQFYIINLLAALVVAFIFYFSLPLRFKTSQPYKMIEAFVRMALGVYIAFLFWLTFGGTTAVGRSLAFMAAAFFFTFPVISEEKEEGKLVIKIESKKLKKVGGGLQIFDRVFFIIIMLVSLGFSGIITAWTGEVTQIMFVAVFALSFITGITAGPEGKPAIGVLMIVIALVTFSTMYTGIIGQQVFGYWWPQVQSFTEMIGDTVGPVWEQAQISMSDAWMILTNPQQYYLNQMIKQTVTPSVITPGGTIKSIELTRFELTTSIPGILEPSEPTIGIMELNNEGDFSSGKINLSIGAVYLDPTQLEEYPIGNISRLFCSASVGGRNSTSVGTPASCDWSGKIYPKEARSITFKIEEGNNYWFCSTPEGPVDLFNDCMDNTDPSSPSPCPCFTSLCPFENTTYEYSGHSVKVKVNLTYDYVVNVSLPITIINSDLYLKKLQAGEIVLQDLTSEYTGGPVKATLFTAKQPARTDIPFLVTASIFNEGLGELLNITNFTITVYGAGAISNVEAIGETFRENPPCGIGFSPCSNIPDGCTDAKSDGKGNWEIICKNIWGTIEKGEFKRVSFYITPNSSTITDEKTTQIVAWANYEYKKTTSQTLTMANAPPQ